MTRSRCGGSSSHLDVHTSFLAALNLFIFCVVHSFAVSLSAKYLYLMIVSLNRLPMLARLTFGILLTVAISLAFFNLLMSPPTNELGLMALFLGITAFVSALVGYAAYRFGWVNLSP